MEVVGSGSYGNVYVCEDNPHLVIKKIRACRASSLELNGLDEFSWGHKFIVHVEQVFEEHDNLKILMRRYPYDVHKYILQTKCNLSLTETLRLEYQIGSALEYMHSHRLLHGDVKPDNIMMDGDRNFLLTDFSLAKSIGEDRITGRNQLYTGLYRPPVLFYNDCVPDGHMVKPGYDFFALFMTLLYVRFKFLIAKSSDSDYTIVKKYCHFKKHRFPKLMKNEFRDSVYKDVYFKVFDMCY